MKNTKHLWEMWFKMFVSVLEERQSEGIVRSQRNKSQKTEMTSLDRSFSATSVLLELEKN